MYWKEYLANRNEENLEERLLIDASMLRDFGNCREFFRRRWVENLESKRPSIDRSFGIAVHKAVEAFWRGKDYSEAYSQAASMFGALDLTHTNVKDREKYERLSDALPEVIGVYYEEHGEAEDQAMVEYEWVTDFPVRCRGLATISSLVSLCGRIDRYSFERTLYDVKTASEIGRNWKSDYKEAALREIGIALYDWYLHKVQPDSSPRQVVLEVLVKPYGNKPARYEHLELPEVVTDSYRRRFDQLLDFRVRELAHWWGSYQAMKPWPQNDGSQCVSKYGQCDYLKLCNHGDSPRNLELYTIRQEHLEARR